MKENGLSVLPDVVTFHREDMAMQTAATEGYNEAINCSLPKKAVLFNESIYDAHDHKVRAQMEGRE